MTRSRKVWLWTGPAALTALTLGLWQGCRTTTVQTDLKDVIADRQEYTKGGLTMTADQETGEVYASFSASEAGLQEGDQVILRWDVIQRAGNVNCSRLRRQETVAVTSGNDKVELRFRVDPALLLDALTRNNSVGGHGMQYASKYGAAGDDAFVGETYVDGCLEVPGRGVVAAAGSLPDPLASEAKSGMGLADDDSDLPIGLRYGERCAKAIGYVKPFSCIDDGQVVPITVDGVESEKHVQKCDNPQYLPLGGGTQCAALTRVGRLKVYTDKTYTQERTDATAVFFCRHYEDVSEFTLDNDPATAGKRFPYFKDVAIIMQNISTSSEDSGKTCFFQALGGGRTRTVNGQEVEQGREGEDIYGVRVAPPTESQQEFEAEMAKPENEIHKNLGAQPAWNGFWLSPSGIGGIHCISCHDSDPFMHSPWIDQVTWQGPNGAEKIVPGRAPYGSLPDVPYKIIGAGVSEFKKWATSYAVEPDNAKCASCHRLGSMATCRDWARDAYPLHAAGEEAATSNFFRLGYRTGSSMQHPQHHWMPPPAPDFVGVDGYRKSAEQFRKCCNMPRPSNVNAGPRGSDDPSTMLGYGSINDPAGQKLSEEEISYLNDNGCAVTPISEVVPR